MKIPFVDLKSQYLSIKNEIDEAIAGIINETAFIGGDAVKKFEKEFASHNTITHCISCANGTDSIEMLLKSYSIGIGDEVIVPAISWISTSEAVSAVGAKPIFVDIDEKYYTIDSSKIEEKITKATKAIIPVHLYGQPADMPAIKKIAEKHNLIIIEDCAQSHDAEIDSKKVGLWGHSSSYSFYPGKNLGAYGDAGCMTTNDDKISQTVRMLANHGQLKKHDHVLEGRNSRLDGIQAAILSAKLPHLTKWTAARIKNAEYYNSLLKGSLLILPSVRANAKHVFHLYVVRVKNRQFVMDTLKKHGIDTAIHYPTALPFLPCYSDYHHTSADFPIAAACQTEILSLPLFAELTKPAMEYVAEHIRKVTSQS